MLVFGSVFSTGLLCGSFFVPRNWLQSVLMTLMVAAKPWGCRYGVLPHFATQSIEELRLTSGSFEVHWEFLSPLNMIFWMRMLAYLAAVIWMQWLLERRIHVFEKSSGREYGGRWVFRLLQFQALWVLGGTLTVCPGIALNLMPSTRAVDLMLSIACVLGLAGGAIFMAANLLSAAIAIGALCHIVGDLNQARKRNNTPVPVKKRLEEAWRINLWQTVAVALSLFLSVGLSPAVLWQVHMTFSFDMKAVQYPAEHMTSVLVGVSVQVLDVLGNALAVILLSGTYRVMESDRTCNCPTSSCCFKRHQMDPSWRKKVEECQSEGLH